MLLKCLSVSLAFMLLANVFHYVLQPEPTNPPLSEPSSSPSSSSKGSSSPEVSDPLEEDLLLANNNYVLRDKMILEHWLTRNGWQHLLPEISRMNIGSLSELSKLQHVENFDLEEAVEYLPDKEGLPGLERLIWDQILEESLESLETAQKGTK